ncbi:MAG TPA: hypothetical protein VHQ65_08515 [Thermoanaerobaculia bacterium]|nr:hypothetical protein [Thermoanaerobaculia bacterium]
MSTATSIRRFLTTLALALGLVALGACGSGGLDDILGGSTGGNTPPPSNRSYDQTVVGEVQEVDTRLGELELIDDRNRTLRVLYEPDTQVIYQGQAHRVENLERGDVVRVRMWRDDRGNYRTDSMTVEENVRDRAGYDPPPAADGPWGDPRYDDEEEGYRGDVETLAGVVQWIDDRRGRFEMRTDRHGTVEVRLPYNPSPADRQRFEGLRSGDRVSVRGEWLTTTQLELVSFEGRV